MALGAALPAAPGADQATTTTDEGLELAMMMEDNEENDETTWIDVNTSVTDDALAATSRKRNDDNKTTTIATTDDLKTKMMITIDDEEKTSMVMNKKSSNVNDACATNEDDFQDEEMKTRANCDDRTTTDMMNMLDMNIKIDEPTSDSKQKKKSVIRSMDSTANSEKKKTIDGNMKKKKKNEYLNIEAALVRSTTTQNKNESTYTTLLAYNPIGDVNGKAMSYYSRSTKKKKNDDAEKKKKNRQPDAHINEIEEDDDDKTICTDNKASTLHVRRRLAAKFGIQPSDDMDMIPSVAFVGPCQQVKDTAALTVTSPAMTAPCPQVKDIRRHEMDMTSSVAYVAPCQQVKDIEAPTITSATSAAPCPQVKDIRDHNIDSAISLLTNKLDLKHNLDRDMMQALLISLNEPPATNVAPCQQGQDEEMIKGTNNNNNNTIPSTAEDSSNANDFRPSRKQRRQMRKNLKRQERRQLEKQQRSINYDDPIRKKQKTQWKKAHQEFKRIHSDSRYNGLAREIAGPGGV